MATESMSDDSDLVLSLAKVLSGAAPEFQDRAAQNHLNQARRLLQSEWFSILLKSTRQEGLREGWREGHRQCRCHKLGMPHVNPYFY